MTLAANISEYYWYIAVAIGGVLHWISERNKKKAEAGQPPEPQQQQTPAQPQPADNRSEQERLKKFMEALGIPQGQQPPPAPRAPRPVVAIPKPRPIVRVPVPVVPRPFIAPEMEMMSHESHNPGTHALEQQAPAPSPSDAGKLASQSRNILELLQSPRDLRAMLLAREILGPPPGLQS